MNAWNCKQCGKFPNGDVYQCAAKEHIWCVPCKEERNRTLCVCGAKMRDEKISNPIERLLMQAKVSCPYQKNGCTWAFMQSEMDAHVTECRYRPYRCVADTMNVLKCDWIGLQYEIEDHLSKGHKQLGPVFRFREATSLVFKEQVSLGGLKVVDAFSKKFMFYFFSDAHNKRLSFLMVYFGRREEAEQYCYKLELRSQPEEAKPSESSSAKGKESKGQASDSQTAMPFVRSVKFMERCVSDSENLSSLLEEERCVALSHRQVLQYLNEDKLHIVYQVYKVNGARERTTSAVSTGEEAKAAVPAKGKQKPKPPPFNFAQKGVLATNGKRSSSSSSGTSSSSSTSLKSDTSTSTSTSKSSSQHSRAVPSRSPSSASTVTMSSERNSVAVPASPSTPLSSINRLTMPLTPFDKPEHCPLMTPSINKMDMPPSWSVAHMTSSTFTCNTTTEYHRQLYGQDPHRVKQYPSPECTTTAAVCQKYTQPYKVQDDRPYLMKHPTNCLYKPQPKWSASGDH